MNQNQTLHWFACVGGDENNANGNGITVGNGGNNNENVSRDNDNDNLPFNLLLGGEDEGIVLQSNK